MDYGKREVDMVFWEVNRQRGEVKPLEAEMMKIWEGK